MAYGFQVTNPNGNLVIDDSFRNYSFFEKRLVTFDAAGIGSFLVSTYTDVSPTAPKPRVFVKLKGGEFASVLSIRRATGVATGFAWDNREYPVEEASASFGIGTPIRVAYYYDGPINNTGTSASFTGTSASIALNEKPVGCDQAGIVGEGEQQAGERRGSFENAVACQITAGFIEANAERYGNVSIDFIDGFPSDDVEGGFNGNAAQAVNHRSPSSTVTSTAISVSSGGAGWTIGETVTFSPRSIGNLQALTVSSDLSGSGINNVSFGKGLTLICTSLGEGWAVETLGTPNTTAEFYVFAPVTEPPGGSGGYGLEIFTPNGDTAFSTSNPQLILTDILSITATWNLNAPAQGTATGAVGSITNFTFNITSGLNQNTRNIPSGNMAVSSEPVAHGFWYRSAPVGPPRGGPPPTNGIWGISGLTVNATNTVLTCISNVETATSQTFDGFAAPRTMYPYWETTGTRHTGTGASPTSVQITAQIPVINTTVIDNILGF